MVLQTWLTKEKERQRAHGTSGEATTVVLVDGYARPPSHHLSSADPQLQPEAGAALTSLSATMATAETCNSSARRISDKSMCRHDWDMPSPLQGWGGDHRKEGGNMTQRTGAVLNKSAVSRVTWLPCS